jgi:cytochrome c5
MKKRTQQALIVLVFIISGLLGLSLSLYLHPSEPYPVLKTEIMQTFHYPATFVKQLENDPEAGRKIFNEFCSVCHAEKPVIAVKAPRIGDREAWKSLRQAGSSALLKITIQGVGRMPARGGCFECSDAQLEETITYILQKSS